jgi:acetyl-CoA acyltransferase
MSRVPMMGFNPLPNPALAKKSAAYLGMGDTAENVAAKFGITREAQEAFAVESQRKAGAAIAAGLLNDEIVPVGGVDADGTRVRAQRLKPWRASSLPFPPPAR